VPLPPVLDPATSALHRWRRSVRRAVLRRRRWLAAAAAAGAVLSGAAAVADPPPDRVPVLVADRDLPAGAVLRSADLELVDFAPGSLPAGVLDRRAVGRTLAAPLREGEAVTDVRLVGPALADPDPGLVAVPVRLPDAGMVALLRVGDAIDLVATDPAAGLAAATDPAPTAGSGGSVVVARGVPILALPTEAQAGASSGTTDPGARGGRLVVLGLADPQVTQVANATARAFVTFTWSSR